MPSLNRTTSLSGLDSMSHTFSHTVSYSEKFQHSQDIDNKSIGKHRRRVVFLLLASSNVVNNMCLALMAPIFPQIVSKILIFSLSYFSKKLKNVTLIFLSVFLLKTPLLAFCFGCLYVEVRKLV